MEIFTLLPILLKVLPFAAIGVLYALWRMAAYGKAKAKEEAAAYKASYELAGEVVEIKREEGEANAKIDGMDVSELADTFRGLRGRPKG